MSYSRSLLLSLLMAAVLMHTVSAALACTVCHSKNPKMVRMHDALGYKDCFVCHGPAAKNSTEDPNKRMASDGRCVRCHARTQR